MRALLLIAFAALRLGAQGVSVGVDGAQNQGASLAAAGQFVALTFAATAAGGTDVYFAASLDGGASFRAPVRVNATPGDARMSGEQPPRLALVARRGGLPDVVIVWSTKAPEGTRLLFARSRDGGRSFGASALVPGSDGAGNRGWESITVDAAGKVGVLWLDHRESAKSKAMSAAMPEMKHDPTAQAESSKLYFALLDDAQPRVITGGVCYCCKTSLVTAADGSIYGAWRHVYPGSQRDIALTVSRDGGRTFSPPAKVSDDHWQFDGCPENGPALAVDHEGRVHVAWPTPADGKTGSPLALFHAMSKDGKTFTPRVRVPNKGPASHVQMAFGADGALTLVWDEITTAGRKIRAARAQADAAGNVRFSELTALDTEPGTYPVIAATPSGMVVAWVKPEGAASVIAVRRIAP